MSIKYTILNMTKKTRPLKQQDWHAADVVAAVRKLNMSLQRLSRLNGLHQSTLGQALYKPYPKSERIIAEFLNLNVQQIWPNRYNSDGTAKSGRGERGLGRNKSCSVNDTPVKQSRNVYATDKAAA